MGGVVSSFFQLVLGVSSKFTPDTIDKGLGVSKILLEKGLEPCPRDHSGAFVAMLVLNPLEADGVAKKGDSKWGTIYPYSV